MRPTAIGGMLSGEQFGVVNYIYTNDEAPGRDTSCGTTRVQTPWTFLI